MLDTTFWIATTSETDGSAQGAAQKKAQIWGKGKILAGSLAAEYAEHHHREMRPSRHLPLSPQASALPLLLLAVAPPPAAAAVGLNWGFAASHPRPAAQVVHDLLLPNSVPPMRLSVASPNALAALAGTGVAVTVGVPNELVVPMDEYCSSKTRIPFFLSNTLFLLFCSTWYLNSRIDYFQQASDLIFRKKL